MVDSPARIQCKICGEQNTFDNESPRGVFSYSPCQKCDFPLLYRNTNPNQHALNRRTFEKYAEAAQLWGAEKYALRATNQALEVQNIELQRKLAGVSGDHIPPEPKHLSGSVDDLLIQSKHISQLEQYIQDIGDRLNLIEESTPETNSHIANNARAIQDCIKTVQSFESSFSDTTSKQGGDLPSRYTIFIPSLSQLQTQELVDLYNSTNIDDFVERSVAKRAGATVEAMKIHRSTPDSEALFQTGQGNYWLFTPEHPHLACLVPNRKTFRLSPNTIDSLKICFELTHDRSLRNFKFSNQNADMTTVQLVHPAILDAAEDTTLWKLRTKGVLLFPLKRRSTSTDAPIPFF